MNSVYNVVLKDGYKVLGLKDLYEILPFGKTKIMELIKANKLPVMKIGKDYITSIIKIEEWISKNIGEEIYY